MAGYTIEKNYNEIYVDGYEQSFSEEDIKSLWDEHKILYIKGGIMAVWVEDRENGSPLIHLMGEDDGHIYWQREDTCFDSGWLDNYIETLSEVKNKVLE